MRALIIYDSQFGNTQKIAEAIGQGMRAAVRADDAVEVRPIGDVLPSEVSGLDLLLVGSPTHAFRATPETKNWLKAIPGPALQNVAVTSFDTRFPEEFIKSESRILTMMSGLFGFAAEPMGDELQKKGGLLIVPPEGFYVTGTEGPLADGELTRAEGWGRHIGAQVIATEAI